jgi:DNA-3-methyladenine glycosylase II
MLPAMPATAALRRAPAGVPVRQALRVLRADPPMARLIERVGPMRLQPSMTPSPFEALVHAITHQQLNGTAARTILGRVCALFPTPEVLDPSVMRALPDHALRGAGLSRAKLAAMRDLAEKTLDGTVPDWGDLHALEDEAIVERLTQVRGVGRWTVEMLLIFRLGRPDVLPVADFGVRNGFARTYRKRKLPTPRQLALHGERWRPFRSVASWYLWRATELPPER